jgi:hypothetical protein
MDADTTVPAAGRNFFATRWRGERPLSALFWRDMMLWGSLINIAATIAGALLLGFKAPAWLAVAIHFSPVPWNLFLLASVWRTADRLGPARAFGWQLAATAWFLAATVA